MNRKRTIVAFADKIYSRSPITPDLWEHEKMHCQQQGGRVITAIPWVIMYLFSKKFRFRMELEAYRVQYEFCRRKYGLVKRLSLLSRMAKDLSGPLYGELVDYHMAKELIADISLNKHGI
jgi:hypothetical protein